MGCGAVVHHFVMHVCKEPCGTSSHTSYKSVIEILNGHEDRCHQQFMMKKHIFQKLLVVLEQQYNHSSKARHMPLEKALAIFLTTLGHGFSNRMVQERFQHSSKTVSRWFNTLLDVICRMVVDVIKPIDSQFKSTSDKIKKNTRYWPYFKDCIGAIDGTNIQVVAPKGKNIPYIGRKSITTQNIMVICDFNMCFTFVWAGLEGVAHDARIFVEALRRSHLGFLHLPKGKILSCKFQLSTNERIFRSL